MKTKNTLILLLVAGAIFAFIVLFEKKQPTTAEARDRAGRVLQFDRDEVNSITIKNSEMKIELRKGENSQWRLEEPVKDRADSMAVNQLFTTAESLRHDAVIGNDGKGVGKDQIKDFGLASSEIKVRFSGPAKPIELLIGKDAAVDGKVYVRRDDENVVYVIPNELKNQLTKKADEFRDHKLTDLVATQVNRLLLKSAAGEIELQKKDEQWSLIKPLQARGDASKIGDLISQATNAKVETFIGDTANLATYELVEPRGTLSLFSEGRKDPEVLQIGGKPKEEKDKEKTYARLSSRDAVVVLPQAIEKLLETQPNDLRDRNLLRVEADIVDRITIEGGAYKVVLARSGENWVKKEEQDVPVPASQALRVISDLQSQQVADFAADAAGDLAKYGLDMPSLKVTLSSFASENTPDTTAGEKPIVTALFGKLEGDNVYAKLENEPFIVTVPKEILNSFPSDPLQWQELSIFKTKSEEVTALEVTKSGESAISFIREKDQWKLSKGDGAVNQVNVQSLVNTVSSLSAVRWAGAASPSQGLDQPVVAVTFKKADGTASNLRVGAKTAEEMWHATAEGKTGTFLMSRPDVEAMQLPLMDKKTTAPAPAAALPAPAAGDTAPESTGIAPTTEPAAPTAPAP